MKLLPLFFFLLHLIMMVTVALIIHNFPWKKVRVSTVNGLVLHNCSYVCGVCDVIWKPPRSRNMSPELWGAICWPLGKRIQKLEAASFSTEPCQDKWDSIHQGYGTAGDCQLGSCHTNLLCVSPFWTCFHCLDVTKEMYYKSLVQRRYLSHITDSVSWNTWQELRKFNHSHT